MSAISARGAKKLQDELENYALSMPEAWFDTPWDDERVTKVRKKIFAIYGSQDRPSIGVRLQESHDEGVIIPDGSLGEGCESLYSLSLHQRVDRSACRSRHIRRLSLHQSLMRLRSLVVWEFSWRIRAFRALARRCVDGRCCRSGDALGSM